MNNLYKQYQILTELKNQKNLLTLRNKKTLTLGTELQEITNQYEINKKAYKASKKTRMDELSNLYDLDNYIRKDGQFINLHKIDHDMVADILKNITDIDTDRDINELMFILLFELQKEDIQCASHDCQEIPDFNKSTYNFKRFCNIKHKDIIQIKRDKAKKTYQEKYGVNNPNQIENLIRNNKVPHTYKTNHHMQNNIKNIKNYNKEYIVENFINDNYLELDKMMEYFNISKSTAYKQLATLDIQYIKQNRIELEIKEFLESLVDADDIEYNSRKIIPPYELDFFVNNLAIEFNGLYWHSYGIKNTNPKQNDIHFMKNRHLDKTIECEAKNIQLFHIFENEWLDPIKQELWKSKIRYKLNKTPNSIMARKCIIKNVSAKEANIFSNDNHLQGAGSSSIRYGLYYKDELVSLMTFKKDTKYQYELNRFCTKKNLNIPGAASKLLKHFEREINPESLVSYANRRWSMGNLYDTLGFYTSHVSAPNYFYFNSPHKLESRISYQKHKLKDKLKIFDSAKTEFQNMMENNYRVIYDAGNIIHVKKY